MKQISYWASTHVTVARPLIVIIKILMAALAYYTGLVLTHMQVVLPVAMLNGFVLVLMLGCVVYYPVNAVYFAWLETNQPQLPALTDVSTQQPISLQNNIDSLSVKRIAAYKKLHYARRKLCDFLLPLCAVLVIITSVNHAGVTNITAVVYGSNIVKGITAQEILQSGKSRESLTRKEKRVLKREFFKQLKVYATASLKGDETAKGNAGKIILAIIVLVGLLFLLMSLVCSLSCAGSDVAAVLVGVLGLAGLIWGFVAVLNAIKRKQSVTGNVLME